MNEPFDAIAYINEPRWQASRLGLHRISDLMERLGRPQDRLRFVHVAGTNGKGSTCAYLASILRAAGYRTGLFTSPYIERFEERIQVDGVPIALDALCQATLQVREAAEAQAAATGEHATEFELMTAVALVHFATVSCDIVVLEVGLGGRLDSTNVIGPPEVAVITRIGLDHTALLGDSPAAIAGEKAGIIKPGCAVVAYPQDDEGAARAIAQAASRCETPLIVADFSQLTVGEVRPAGESAAVESDARLPLPGEPRHGGAGRQGLRGHGRGGAAPGPGLRDRHTAEPARPFGRRSGRMHSCCSCFQGGSDRNRSRRIGLAGAGRQAMC